MVKFPQRSQERHLIMLSEQAKKRIAVQRRQYIESMPVKKKVILKCMSQVSVAVRSGEPDLCDELFQQVHRLAGSAGSYGFDSLGYAASVVDRYLIAHSPKVRELPKLAAMLQSLLDEIDEIIKNSDNYS